MEQKVTSEDKKFLERTIELANEAERLGNLPIGAVIVLDGKIVSEGKNAVFYPTFDMSKHAELVAIQKIDGKLFLTRGKDMTLYTNIEPCVMCFGSIVLNKIGRVVFGGSDKNKGAAYLCNHIDKIYSKEKTPVFVGPVDEKRCGEMWDRANIIYRANLEKLKKGAKN